MIAPAAIGQSAIVSGPNTRLADEGGEPRDIRNQICLSIWVGLGAPCTRVDDADGNGCGHQQFPS
jgi:hypothetical protein